MLICCAVAMTGWLLLNPVSTNPLCENGSYRHAHPLICDTGEDGPFTVGPGGGDSGGGLLGAIGGLVGGLL